MDPIDQQTIPTEHPVSNDDSGNRRIIFVTDPEKQLKLAMNDLGQAFYKEANLPGVFHVEHWVKQWTAIIQAHLGYMWLMFNREKAIGGIGVLMAPDLCNGDLVMQEAFWFISKEHRRGLGGIKLLKEVEKFAKEAGICRLFVGRNHHSDPENKVGAMLERTGYLPIETNYFKTICQND
jgi:hypothetical protein